MKKRTRRPAKQDRSRKRSASAPAATKRNDRDKYGRFLKGVSGNPNGRPRLSKGILAARAILEEIEQGVDGVAAVAPLLKLHQMAVAGDMAAMRLYLQLRFGLPRMVDVPEMPEGKGSVESTEYRVRFVTKEQAEANGNGQNGAATEPAGDTELQ